MYEDTLLDLEKAVKQGHKVDGIVLPEVILEIRQQPPKQSVSQTTTKVKKAHGPEIVGKHVKVYWPKFKKTYYGKVAQYDDKGQLHLVHYKDGEQKWTDFRKEKRYHFVQEREARKVQQQEDSDLLGSPYEIEEEPEVKRGGRGRQAYSVPLVDDSHNKTGVMIRVNNKNGPPQVCGITQVQEVDDGYEIYAVLPGLTLDDVSVSCSPDGRVAIDGHSKDSNTTHEVGLQPVHQVLQLPAKLKVGKTVAILTLHGLLYVKLFCQ